jgi:hypothetical protein
VHVLYYWGLRVPDQRRYWRSEGGPPLATGRWEARFCLHGFFALLGVIAVGLGFRAFAVQAMPYLAILVPVGVMLIGIFAPRAVTILRQLHAVLRTRKAAA